MLKNTNSMQRQLNQDVIVKSFVDEVVRTFESDSISAILYYGSRAYDRFHATSDYDLMVLIKSNKNPRDLIKIGKIANKYPNFDITFRYLSDIESIGWDKFRHGSHGIFFMHVLAGSTILYGDNIFARKLAHIDPVAYKQALNEQIEDYFWRLNHWAVNDAENICNDIAKYQKYIARIIQDMLVYHGDISYQEINHCQDIDLFGKYVADKSYFSGLTKRLFANIFEIKVTNTMIVQLMYALYEDYLKGNHGS